MSGPSPGFGAGVIQRLWTGLALSGRANGRRAIRDSMMRVFIVPTMVADLLVLGVLSAEINLGVTAWEWHHVGCDPGFGRQFPRCLADVQLRCCNYVIFKELVLLLPVHF
jgi:hypothetical protein